MSRRRVSVLPLLAVMPLLCGNGCGDSAPKPSGSPPAPPGREQAVKDRQPAGAGGVDGKPAFGAKGDGEATESAITRKVIYDATVEVVVKDVDDTRAEVNRTVETYKGYIAKSDISGRTGSKRTASWTLKVPADHFHMATTDLAKLGTLVKNSSDSKDVTEEFVDLQARVKNLKAEEETLNKFLKELVSNVDGYIKTREQIKNVRGDIERAEGRLKYLAAMSAMSTIDFTAREDVAYTPAPPEAAPTFGGRLSSTFGQSWDGFISFCQSVVLLVVALLPWAPVILIGGMLLRWLVKRVIAANYHAEQQRRGEKVAGRREHEANRSVIARPVDGSQAHPADAILAEDVSENEKPAG